MPYGSQRLFYLIFRQTPPAGVGQGDSIIVLHNTTVTSNMDALKPTKTRNSSLKEYKDIPAKARRRHWTKMKVSCVDRLCLHTISNKVCFARLCGPLYAYMNAQKLKYAVLMLTQHNAYSAHDRNFIICIVVRTVHNVTADTLMLCSHKPCPKRHMHLWSCRSFVQ